MADAVSALDLFRLDGKVAIVTGASRGLGRESALALADAGADVAICDTLEAEGQDVCDEIRARGRRALFQRVDITEADEVQAFTDAVANELGEPHILVNNAALPSIGASLEEIDDDAWRRSIDVNISGLFYVTKPVAKRMIANGGGVIINMASISGIVISNIFPRHNVEYCTAKAAVAHLTKGMASEWAQYGIRANAIAPGYIRTAQTSASARNPEIVERIINATPLHRYGDINELQGAVIFLASQASSFMTGSVVVVDGGLTVW
jgi:NAD(P)-dependent dehydrogenase (short-subunit alcohol dehydrogenase family)